MTHLTLRWLAVFSLGYFWSYFSFWSHSEPWTIVDSHGNVFYCLDLDLQRDGRQTGSTSHKSIISDRSCRCVGVTFRSFRSTELAARIEKDEMDVLADGGCCQTDMHQMMPNQSHWMEFTHIFQPKDSNRFHFIFFYKSKIKCLPCERFSHIFFSALLFWNFFVTCIFHSNGN